MGVHGSGHLVVWGEVRTSVGADRTRFLLYTVWAHCMHGWWGESVPWGSSGPSPAFLLSPPASSCVL